MSGTVGPVTAIADFSGEDGWRKGIVTYQSGGTFQFFISPSGQVRLYVWREGRQLNGVRPGIWMARDLMAACDRLVAERIAA